MKKLKDFLRCLVLLYKRVLYFIAKCIEKTDDNTVIFEAFQGRSVACNPKAIYREMLTNPKYDNYNFIWALRNTDRPDIYGQKNTKVVRYESFGYYRALVRAKYWIFNSNTRPFLKPGKHQIFIQTWHGTPLKKIGCDVKRMGNAMTKFSDIEKIYTNEAKKISYMISPSDYCTGKFISAFHMDLVGKKDRVLTTGYPRNDFLFQASEKGCADIKNRLGIPLDKKVILYAPTFRDNKYSAREGFKLESYMNFAHAKDELGEEYVILFRAHYFISGRMDLTEYKNFVYDVSNVEDINDLYVISDILVTDYSSVFFDYANLRRPIIFYMCDYDEYKNELRDFYFDIDELPGAVVRTESEVFKEIKKVSANFSADKKYLQFNNKFNYLDGPDAGRRVLEKIMVKGDNQ